MSLDAPESVALLRSIDASLRRLVEIERVRGVETQRSASEHVDHEGVRQLRAACDRFLSEVEERGPGRILGAPQDGPQVPLENVMSKMDFM